MALQQILPAPFSTTPKIEEARSYALDDADPKWLEPLRSKFGDGQVHADFETRLAHSRDRLPYGRFQHRSGRLTRALPGAVLELTTIEQTVQAVDFATENNLCVIPFGNGSGVLGGTVPFDGELVLSLRKMDKIIEVDEQNNVVRVEAGVNGRVLETALNERGYTCGHFPQSLDMSTVGGWVACRGSGQGSTRYGNIENMVVGMQAILPNGKTVTIRHAPRRSVGPSLIDIFIGSEGTLGLIVEVTLKIWRCPAHAIESVVCFPSVGAGLNALRDVMQAELRPSLLRLYDRGESERWGEDDLAGGDQSVLCMVEFSGRKGVADAEQAEANDIFEKHGGSIVGEGPVQRWKSVRFKSHSDAHVDAGGYYDTIEVSAPWSRIEKMYDAIRSQITEKHAVALLNAHWSHAYSDGACMYMTMKLPAVPDDAGFRMHTDIWNIVMRTCLDMGGSISHHHGIGYFRGKWLVEELGGGHEVLTHLKNALDPCGLFNPGKMDFSSDG
ncbi:MAG: FAD-binding oxidoreductase [Alphaproteobacteria bacterium]